MLKLIAFDAEDLSVISAHLQDAIGIVGEMTFIARERRFVALLNRFDWTSAGDGQATGRRRKVYQRRRSALRFERVQSAQVQGIDLSRKDLTLSVLAIEFVPAVEPPGGQVLLHFAGDSTIRLTVECIEAELKDLGPSWGTRRRPEHPEVGVTGASRTGGGVTKS